MIPLQDPRALERVWSEQFEMVEGQGVVRKSELPAAPVQNPHDPEAQWAPRRPAMPRRNGWATKRKWPETVPEGPLEPGEPTPGLYHRDRDPARHRQRRKLEWGPYSSSRLKWDWTNRQTFTWTAPTSRASSWPRADPIPP